MNNIKKILFFALCFVVAHNLYSNSQKKRTFVPLQTISLGTLLKNLSNETSALFYLVDNAGNPVVQQNLSNAIGGKSIQVPNLNTLNDLQKNLLNSLQVAVSENAGPWVTQYLNNVKTYRSQGLAGEPLKKWLEKWKTISSDYEKQLTKIFRTITISTANAQTLGFMTQDKKPITFLFFDDPFPAHTVLGNAQNKMKDLLNDFIKRYKTN